jgi:hypothetical protein
MNESATFRPYQDADLQACLSIFEANFPEYFSPNERTDYHQFLNTCPRGYQLCVVCGEIMGAFGEFDRGVAEKGLNWLLLYPSSQGQGFFGA